MPNPQTWNQFGLQINQSLVEEHYRLMASRQRDNTSLLELGFNHAG